MNLLPSSVRVNGIVRLLPFNHGVLIYIERRFFSG